MSIYQIKRYFFRTKNYWDRRYKRGGNSGSGSYGRLAEFKVSFINNFISKMHITTIADFGCGDGNIASKFIGYTDYIGIDISKEALDICKKRFRTRNNMRFLYYRKNVFQIIETELVLSLDVIFHLVTQSEYVNYLNNLFLSASKYVIIYSSNSIGENWNHVRERNFTRFIKLNFNNWQLIEIANNKFPFQISQENTTSRSDFYVFEKTEK